MTAPVVAKTPSKGVTMILEILEALRKKGRILKFRAEKDGIYIMPNRKVFPVADRVVKVAIVSSSQRRKALRGKRVCVYNPGKVDDRAYKRLKVVLNYFISQPVPLYSTSVAAQQGTFLTLIATLTKWKVEKRIQAFSYLGGWKVKVTIRDNKYPVPIPTSVQSMENYLTAILGPMNNSEHSAAEKLVHAALQEMKKEKRIKSFLIHPRNAMMDGKGIDISVIPNKKIFLLGDFEVHLQVKRTCENANVQKFLRKHVGQKIAVIKIGKNMDVAQVKMFLTYIFEKPVVPIDGVNTGLEEFVKQFLSHRVEATKRGRTFEYVGNGEWVFIDAKPNTL